MRLLVVATKPPWPAIDGGRLVVATTLEALIERGHEIDLVTPLDPRAGDAAALAARLPARSRVHAVAVRPRSWLAAARAALVSGDPLAIARHGSAAVARATAALVGSRSYDAVHVEQLQAIGACRPARADGAPVVLRCQNVESDLWRGRARVEPWLRPILALEAARLARFEGAAVAAAGAAIALTPEDARRLEELAGGRRRVEVVAAPFAPELPPGPDLRGAPTVVTLASAGWAPGADGVRWLVGGLWPAVRARLARAELHVFGVERGLAAPGVSWHGAPADSRTAFAANAVLVACLRYGSGVRMRILEAWARGLPVVATPAAAAGLGARDGVELLLARDGRELAAALERLSDDAALRDAVIAGGRARLAAVHAPARIAASLESIYRHVASARPAPAPTRTAAG